mmetsp:Transcript_34224/g.82155  ORF Transcript_34224/g.82155 Transcript_34224/m.82155 type:complete len:81 (-) Transcript_34224:156-398(-)
MGCETTRLEKTQMEVGAAASNDDSKKIDSSVLVFLGAGVGTTAHALRGSAGPCWGPSDELSLTLCVNTTDLAGDVSSFTS